MPQFDFTTYGSQIFWFLFCFACLYFFLSCVIAPRIRDIVGNRKTTIDGDINFAKSLEITIADLKDKSTNLLKDAALKHKAMLDLAVKDSILKREKSLQELKEKSEKIVEKSKEEIADLVKNSQEKNKEAINDLIVLIERKFTN